MTYEEFSSKYQCMLRESLRFRYETEDYISLRKRLRDMEDAYPEYHNRVEIDISNYANGID
jgi:hypothetical protein